MGQRLSKTTVNSCKVFERKQHNSPHTHHNISTTNSVHAIAENIAEIYEESPKRGLQIPAAAKVNADNIYSQKVQIHHTPIEDLTTTSTNSTPPLSSSCSRQIIIKIQLAKMENECQQQQPIHVNGNTDSIYSNNSKVFTSTPSSNNKIGSGQFLNVTFNQNLLCNGEGELRMATGALMSSESQTNSQKTTLNKNYSQQDVANSSPRIVVNNNFSSNIVVATTPSSTGSENFNILMTPMNELQMNEAHLNVVNSNSSGDMMMVSTANDRKASTTAGTETVSPGNGNCVEDAASIKSECCCRRKSRSSNTFPQKWRCCKCTCRDAIKRILDVSSPSCAFTNTSASKSSKKKDRKETRENSKSPKKQDKQQEQLQHSSQQSTLWTTLQPNSPQLLPGSDPPAVAAVATTAGNTTTQMSIWSPNRNDVIIPISSPQFVVLQCPPSSLVTLGRFDDNAIRLMATELVTTNASATGKDRTNCQSTQLSNQLSINATQADLNDLIVKTAPVAFSAPASSSVGTTSSVATPTVSTCPSTVATNTAGPVVHSQVDYMHCLVPDLERITKASFYWGKMDRYEAERLLEGKPEGTFLLRDSAQEEYLFSVTFRKYGRSLHARIEQSNHKFSFDCHDPCVFTAPTVTGLLEHYKDPACVMFFEPSLTIPLHRNTTFSLQELCRATIVSHTNYDGINELELPSRLKSYLKEYHYKQKLRVKPIDEPFYTCT